MQSQKSVTKPVANKRGWNPMQGVDKGDGCLIKSKKEEGKYLCQRIYKATSSDRTVASEQTRVARGIPLVWSTWSSGLDHSSHS